ncbi:hypothetical protein BW723_15775 [Polaribacter reichenbachii]|uniref:Lipoprotein n=1 Tax=Polaribacter reichenbachii TaxID=996801 RepID=A0A1B8U561_9FLAO|nr:hypothetical protein [Polaribacter reichenbachii]APZ47658.1 hypothetical protein BW723_15775 [Polaribacter reichenbachii]AUC18298.1 hypothetical protein BTO17_06220 [Polaribacter reichenbachii]OBY66989.1 hypothetical protein LPB301_04010 [Polaribacter reichenbachii]
MKKTKVILYLIIASSIFISCKKEIKEMNELLETDFKIIEFYYGYDNYEKNIRNAESEPIIIKERNFLEINVDVDGNCEIEGKRIESNLIIPELKKYLIPNPENESMPKTIEKEFTYAGKIIVNENLLISALFDKDLSYKKYSEIRNKIYIARNEIRNEFATKNYGKTLAELMISDKKTENEQFYELNDIFPFNYSEIMEE